MVNDACNEMQVLRIDILLNVALKKYVNQHKLVFTWEIPKTPDKKINTIFIVRKSQINMLKCADLSGDRSSCVLAALVPRALSFSSHRSPPMPCQETSDCPRDATCFQKFCKCAASMEMVDGQCLTSLPKVSWLSSRNPSLKSPCWLSEYWGH